MARSCLKETGKDDCHTEIEQAGRRTRWILNGRGLAHRKFFLIGDMR